MKRAKIMEPLPNDLILEIFSRMPAKSVARFRTLSKQWAALLRSPDFTKLFLTRSSNRPRLLLGAERNGEWLFFSSLQPHNRYDKSSHLDYHTKFSGDVSRNNCSYASGLIYFPDMWFSKDPSHVICNPVTGMYESLPDLMRYRKARGFLVIDPIDKQKQFKVLSEAYPFSDQREHHKILTFGTGELSWRSDIVSCPAYDRSLSEGICINGVLCYLAQKVSESSCVIVCFDVRSEEFKFIDAECFNNDQVVDTTELVLVNYKGKLGGINWKRGQAGERRTIELCIWVLEDVEKQEWVDYVYTLPENEVLDSCDFSIAGVTVRGEVVLCMKYTFKPFYVFYFNPERNTLQSVEIKGFGANLEAFENRGRVYAFVNHVEDLGVNDAEQLKSSISKVKHLCGCCNKVAQPNHHY
ncbi:PREDICTED: F-box protein At3g57590-like isoform X1 [Camelina sativa]|uniref:F-box protein At3g57590-like isoform X1 n=1 Tax=Camelina sativa TaxID=90675 RepID=A0ABM1RN03_CAMSA|nr:PREDICTED: F-box protein At3g57590-like isoform X1 [Camelina sativa]